MDVMADAELAKRTAEALTAAASAESTHTVCAQLASSERHGSKEERRAGDQPSLLSLNAPCWRDRLNSIYRDGAFT